MKVAAGVGIGIISIFNPVVGVVTAAVVGTEFIVDDALDSDTDWFKHFYESFYHNKLI